MSVRKTFTKLLLANGEEIGLATVYRVLTQFETAGLVVRHNFEGGHSVFELASRSIMTILSVSVVAGLKNLTMLRLSVVRKRSRLAWVMS